MSTRLTVFVSSTVRDFAPVRRDLREWFRRRRIDVRESEDPEFPVDPGLHSSDACLRAIEGCHLHVLLIGWRYGGLYKGTLQSVTWREYDEARSRGIPVIACVLKEVSEEAARIIEARRHLAAMTSRLDPGIVRFVEAVRRGERDNWVHLEWDGSFTHARELIDARMNTLWVAYQRPHQVLEREAARMGPYVTAREILDTLAVEAARGDAAARRRTIDRMLEIAVEYRQALFGFVGNDRWNFVVHRRDGGELKVLARQSHPAIEVHNRSWPLGEGHVGLAGESPENLLVSPNLQQVEGWQTEYPSDEINYRSAVCVPLRDGDEAPVGVLTITSSRVEHFQSLQQVEVLTAISLGSIIALAGVLSG